MSSNVLYVIPNLQVGGTELQLLQLAKGLGNSRFRPHLLALHGGGQLEEHFKASGLVYDILQLKKSLSWGTCRYIKDYCREWEIDILHTFLFGMDLAAVRGARKAKVPYVVTSRRQIPTWKQQRHVKVQVLANRHTDCVICNSKAVQAFICEQEGLPDSATRVIYNGFPAHRIPASPAIKSSGKEGRRRIGGYLGATSDKAVAMVANFSPNKNHERLFEAFKQVLMRDVTARLLLFGDGDRRQALEQSAQEHWLSQAAVFLGQRLDRLELLAECDVLILPSLQEGFPNAVLEAQALGIPVAASRRGGIGELIQHEETGLLFDPENTTDMATQLHRLLTDSKLAHQLAARAQQQVRDRFTDREMIGNYIAFYQDLVSRQGRKSTDLL